MINILIFFMCLVASTSGHQTDSIQTSLQDDLGIEIERELKILNKPPVKSIHTKFGYIVDCIDINKQPAFDHPLLVNHKLQVKPSFQTRIKTTNVKKSSIKAIFEQLEKGQCPKGTVPIKRTTKDDFIRSKSFFGTMSETDEQPSPGTHVAQVTLHRDFKSYYGVGGTSSIYNVQVEKDQSTTTMIWVRNGPLDSLNFIGIGWHVAPQMYNDDATHLFAVWSTDNSKKTGCFNLQCSGFVQTSETNYLGGAFKDKSIYGGTMFEITISILQDPKTNNWWISNENKTLGYFPATLFTNLTAANSVGWGGRTTTSTGKPSPPMGSGHFPDRVFNHASYFRHITYNNFTRQDKGPLKSITRTFSDKPKCFSAEYYGNLGRDVGYSLQFGGPGGKCD